MNLLFSELRAKEIIRLCDAENVGCVSDLLFDAERGCICALYAVPAAGFGAVFSKETVLIPWERVRCIGRDTVLVDLSPEECCPCRGDGGGRTGRTGRKMKG